MLKDVSKTAGKAPRKAKAKLEQLREAAPEATRQGSIVAKSKAVTEALFEKSGSLNETIAVVAHVLQRAEMRPVLAHLGYSTEDKSVCDSIIVDSVAKFIHDHLQCTSEKVHAGTRTTEQTAAVKLVGKVVGSKQLKEERLVKEAADRLGMRYGLFRVLVDERLKMDAELEDGVEVGSLLKVSRARKRNARDDDAECFDEWSHRTCRYDSTQTTGGMKVRRFNDEKV